MIYISCFLLTLSKFIHKYCETMVVWHHYMIVILLCCEHDCIMQKSWKSDVSIDFET